MLSEHFGRAVECLTTCFLSYVRLDCERDRVSKVAFPSRVKNALRDSANFSVNSCPLHISEGIVGPTGAESEFADYLEVGEDEDFRTMVESIVAQGGRVDHVFPPNAVIGCLADGLADQTQKRVFGTLVVQSAVSQADIDGMGSAANIRAAV